MSLSERAKRDILLFRGQRTESHREARDNGFGDAVDAVERFVPKDGDDVAVEVAIFPSHQHARLQVQAWIGERYYAQASALPPGRLMHMSKLYVRDMIGYEVRRMFTKVAEAIIAEHVEWKP